MYHHNRRALRTLLSPASSKNVPDNELKVEQYVSSIQVTLRNVLSILVLRASLNVLAIEGEIRGMVYLMLCVGTLK